MNKDLFARYIGTVVTGLLVLSFGACCAQPQTPTTRPGTVRGWQKFNHLGVPMIGELVLHKDEVSDNGNVAVKVVEIKEGKAGCGLGGEPTEPVVTLLFYRVADPNVSCRLTTGTGGILLDCDERVGLSTLGVLAINPDEGWVYFRLG